LWPATLLPAIAFAVVGPGSGHIQPHVAVIDDNKGISLMHWLKFLETNLFDISLYPAVDRDNLLTYPGVVSKFHIAEMYEFGYYPRGGSDNNYTGHDVGNDFLIAVFHIFPELNKRL